MTEPTRSLSLSESGKTATQLLQCPRTHVRIYNINLFEWEERGDVHSSSLLIDVYASFDVISRRQASTTQAEKFPDPFCSRAMLICSIIWLGKDVVVVQVRSSLT